MWSVVVVDLKTGRCYRALENVRKRKAKRFIRKWKMRATSCFLLPVGLDLNLC